MQAIVKLLGELLTSKKAVAAIAGVIVTLAARVGLDLDPVSVGLIVTSIVAYIVGQGMADMGKEAAKIDAEAERDADSKYRVAAMVSRCSALDDQDGGES